MAEEDTGKAGALLNSRGRPRRGELFQEKRRKDEALDGDWASLSLVWGEGVGCPQEPWQNEEEKKIPA